MSDKVEELESPSTDLIVKMQKTKDNLFVLQEYLWEEGFSFLVRHQNRGLVIKK